jgi:hypothetical protein
MDDKNIGACPGLLDQQNGIWVGGAAVELDLDITLPSSFVTYGAVSPAMNEVCWSGTSCKLNMSSPGAICDANVCAWGGLRWCLTEGERFILWYI